MINYKTKRFALLITLLLLISLLASNFSCICKSNNYVGGGWNPSGIGVLAGKMLFTAVLDGNHETYIMDTDGSSQINLSETITARYFNVNGPIENISTWLIGLSPDGSKILISATAYILEYQENPYGIPEAEGGYVEKQADEGLFVLDFDGSIRRVATFNESDGSYAGCGWTPDGRISFAKTLYVETNDDRARTAKIFVINSDGSHLREIFSGIIWNTIGKVYQQSWSPDGNKMAFKLNSFLYIMDKDGVSWDRYGYNPSHYSWSPDSSMIVYGSSSTSRKFRIIEVGGSNRFTLFENDPDPRPSSPYSQMCGWSPDGSRAWYRPNSGQIYLADPDGSNNVELTTSDDFYRVERLSWSPDSTKIALIAYEEAYDGTPDLYVIDADGSNLTLLAEAVSSEIPLWSPDSNGIAFVSGGDIYTISVDSKTQTRLTTDANVRSITQWIVGI